MRSIGRLMVVLLLLAGCTSSITVRPGEGPDPLRSWRASAVGADDLSPRSLQTLRRWDLEDAYRKDPRAVHHDLQTIACQDPQPELLFALAELSYLLGRQTEKHDPHEACAYYYLCAGAAYHFLFPGPAAAADPLAFDPRFRLACDLYNAGLAKCLRVAQHAGRLDPRQELHLACPGCQGFTLSVVHHGFAWRPEEFGLFQFCADYDPVGLANRFGSYGLGVPLIGTRTPPSGEVSPYYPPEVTFPVTAFFRFDGSIADLCTRRAGRLELFNPLAVRTVQVQDRAVPLESDLTTPLAYFLSRTDLDNIGYAGFLRVDRVQARAGIYMLEPYQPGKIPVLMVHGLLSSPLTWAAMFNDLRADPLLRQHFQFWFYLYPTGNTYLTTAADLRDALSKLRADIDPAGQNPALDRMVCVGHSMGGLVSKLLTVESQGDFWHLVSRDQFAELKVKPETRAELARLFFFDRRSEVERVIFLGTPHHGSALGPSLPGRVASRLVKLPERLMNAAHDLAAENPGLLPASAADRLPTSLDFLAPGAPALDVLAKLPRPTDVVYHSIIGDCTGKGADGSDGVVPYRSAHLDDVASELVVPAEHTAIQSHPRAVQEVRRILLEHLGAREPGLLHTVTRDGE